MTRNEKIEQLRAFIMKLRDIVATADVGDNCKLALPKFHKCEQNLIHFLSDAGFKHDAAVVASHANQVPATYGAPLIQTMEKDVDFYSSKLNAILDDLLNPVYTRAANLPDVPDSNLRTPTWSDIEKEVNNFESLDTDTLRAFSKVPPPPSQNPSFHAQFADTKQQIRDILQERTKLSKSASDGVANDKTEGPIRKIVVGVSIAIIVAIVAGSSSPWWWTVIFPKPAVKKVPPECSPEILRDQLFRAGPDKGVVIKSTARTMREKFRLQEFECVFGLATVFLENDADNGHGLYFSGETWRVKAKQDPKHSDLCRDRMREHFFRYLGNESKLDAGERDGDGKLCYEREKGYCAERTAWINHLMAIDYYQQAEETGDKATKLKRLQRASKFLRIDEDFGGFDQIMPSAVLKEKIEEETKTLEVRD